MFGVAIRGTQATGGRHLLGHAHTDVGRYEAVLVIPLIGEGERRCVVTTQGGEVFLGEDNWLSSDFWDVTDIAHIEPVMSGFRLERGAPRPGEVALNPDGDILLAYYRHSDRGWLRVKDGAVVKEVGALVRFPSWRIMTTRERDNFSLFQIAEPASATKAA